MNFFKSRSRGPSDVVRALRDSIARVDGSPPGGDARRRASEDVSKWLGAMKGILFGADGDEPSPELVAQLSQEVYSSDLLLSLVNSISKFDFEARKDVAQIFNNLLRRQIGSRWPTVDYIATRQDVIFATLAGYDNESVALNTGMILREMLRHEPLTKVLLYSDEFYQFPGYIENTTFGVSCDAFANFKDTLTRHKQMVAEYLEQNYDRFFLTYASLVASQNYVTKRQSLKLLGEILLDRANFNVMTRYIGSEQNLRTMMNLLRDKSKNIQFEAFHVFKVFVANPRKPPQIENILRRNKDKLLNFLRDFHNDREDEQFTDEKQFLVTQIQSL
ncbi:mo25 protein [Calocera cornea HHB12733]|uniref:Mo25 protein n=1 Tax=Calocera cornea HHB12733 TaxID=1353952 RepID=A0A165DV06_9BASI|nr:mo25 protein [Calocera cornea HHB12733]